MTFYDRLVRETEAARRDLYAVPQVVAGMQGKISRETYVAYLAQAYHHVRHTVPFLMTMGSRLPEKKAWLLPYLVEYLKEETGHEQWILNDIKAAGGDADAVRASRPHFATEALVAYNYDYMARRNPVGFLGMVFMLESTSMQIAHAGANAIQKSLDLPKGAFSYLHSHGSLDVGHMEFFKKILLQVADPEDQAAIVEVAQDTFRLFADVLRHIPMQKEGAVSHAA